MADTPRLNLVCPVHYDWAYNKLKLGQAYSTLVLNGHIKQGAKLTEKDEEAIKELYIARRGLLASEQKKSIALKRPKSTSNVDNASGKK